MRQFSPVRKAFLIAGLVFVLNYVLGVTVALQMNLSDPGLGGSSRDHWLTTGTPLTAPLFFMVVYALLLVLATRQRWMGITGIVGVSLLTAISALSLTGDWGLVLHVVEYHLTILSGLSVAVLIVSYPIIIVLGIATLIQQRHARMSAAIP